MIRFPLWPPWWYMHFGVYFHPGRTAIVVRFLTLYDRGQPHFGGFSFVFQGSCEENVSFSFITLTHNRWSCISTFMFVQYRYRYSYYSYLIDVILLLGWLPNLSSDGYVFLVQNSRSWIGKCNSSQNSISLRVLGIAGGLLSCEFPHCWWGCLKLPSQSARLVTRFRAWKLYSHAISAGRSHKKCPEDCQEGRLVFLEDFTIMPIKEAITLVTHEFSFSFFCFQYSPNNIEVFQIYMQIYTQVAANPRWGSLN